VKRWSADDVYAWANSIDGIQEDVGSIFKRNSITGCELLAFNMDGLKMLGIERAGTVCLLQKEIEVLAKANQEVVSLIDHCPYCFGKIFDYLRLKQLHAEGLSKDNPRCPMSRSRTRNSLRGLRISTFRVILQRYSWWLMKFSLVCTLQRSSFLPCFFNYIRNGGL